MFCILCSFSVLSDVSYSALFVFYRKVNGKGGEITEKSHWKPKES